MFGVAVKEDTGITLDSRVESSDSECVLRRIRQTLLIHAVTMRIKKIEKNRPILDYELIEILKQLNPTAQHRLKTWKVYAKRIIQWLAATGFLIPSSSGGWIVEDRGDINPGYKKISVGYYNEEHYFIGDSSPAYALEALEWLIRNENPVTSWSEFQNNNLRNAAQTIRNLGIIVRDDGKYVVTEKYNKFRSCLEMLWFAATNDKTLKMSKNYIIQNPFANGRALGEFLNKELNRNWSDSSIDRVGNSLRQWSVWLIMGDQSDKIPDPIGARYKKISNEKQGRLFD